MTFITDCFTRTIINFTFKGGLDGDNFVHFITIFKQIKSPWIVLYFWSGFANETTAFVGEHLPGGETLAGLPVTFL